MKLNNTAALFLILLLAPGIAAAGNVELGLVGGLTDLFAEILKGFEQSISSTALKLAGVLLSVEVAYFWYQKWGSSEVEELSSILMLLLKHLVLIGFWFWAMTNSHWILESIYNFFVSTGKAGAPAVNIDNMVSYGISLGQQVVTQADVSLSDAVTRPIVVLTVFVAQICIILAFVICAAQILLAKIEFLLVMTAAPIYMAFGVFKFSRDWATKTMSHAVATGTKILVIFMLAAAMIKLADRWGLALATASVVDNPNQLLEIIAGSLLLIMLSFFVPSVAAALMSGNTSLAGSSAIMGSMAIGAAATAGVAGAAQFVGAAKDQTMAGAAGLKDFLGGVGTGSMAESGSKGGGGAPSGGAAGFMPGGGSDAGAGGVNQPSAPPANLTGGGDAPSASAGRAVSPPAAGEATGSMAESGAKVVDGASQPSAPNMQSQIQGDANRIETAQAQGGDVISAADKRQHAESGGRASQPEAPFANSAPFADMAAGGDASTASIGSAVSPPGVGADKPKIRDKFSGAADQMGGIFSHGQNLTAPLDDKTQVGGANIRVD